MRLRILVRDETNNWCDDVVAIAGKVYGIYLYNPKVGVHCCELTPSYELTFLGSIPADIPQDEEQREKLFQDIMEGDCQCEPCSYIHCHTVDSMPKVRRRQRYRPPLLQPCTYAMRHVHGYNWESVEEAQEFWRQSPDF